MMEWDYRLMNGNDRDLALRLASQIWHPHLDANKRIPERSLIPVRYHSQTGSHSLDTSAGCGLSVVKHHPHLHETNSKERCRKPVGFTLSRPSTDFCLSKLYDAKYMDKIEPENEWWVEKCPTLNPKLCWWHPSQVWMMSREMLYFESFGVD